MPKHDKSDDEWHSELTPEQYYVCREKGTERPFTGEYWNSKTPGIYRCICSGEPLFSSTTRFDSGSGWPASSSPWRRNPSRPRPTRAAAWSARK